MEGNLVDSDGEVVRTARQSNCIRESLEIEWFNCLTFIVSGSRCFKLISMSEKY